MKRILIWRPAAWLLVVAFFSCGKSSSLPGTASLTVVNTVAGANPLIANFNGTVPIQWYANVPQMNYGAVNTYNSYSGHQELAMYQYPDTTAHSVPLFNLRLDLPAGTIHTLFLTGTAGAPDTLFTTDNPPYLPTPDSSIAIRFVNLSPGSSPVSVDVQGRANGSEEGSLVYKGITAFRSYPATAGVSSYVFEFRDKASGVLLASYTVDGVNNGAGGDISNNLWRYRSFTLVLAGSPGASPGSGSQSAFVVNNY